MVFKNLRAIREDNDLRQSDIAKMLNVSQNTYSQYETGVIALTAEVLIKLADYYGVSVDYLLDRTDKKWTHSQLREWGIFYDLKN